MQEYATPQWRRLTWVFQKQTLCNRLELFKVIVFRQENLDGIEGSSACKLYR